MWLLFLVWSREKKSLVSHFLHLYTDWCTYESTIGLWFRILWREYKRSGLCVRVCVRAQPLYAICNPIKSTILWYLLHNYKSQISKIKKVQKGGQSQGSWRQELGFHDRFRVAPHQGQNLLAKWSCFHHQCYWHIEVMFSSRVNGDAAVDWLVTYSCFPLTVKRTCCCQVAFHWHVDSPVSSI